MPDEQHPEWWYTAWYVDDSGSIRAQGGQEPSYTDDHYVFVADADRMLPLEVAEVVVAFWNETHAAPGAPLVEDAGETGAFLDEKPGDE
jgi:hypothetical protein